MIKKAKYTLTPNKRPQKISAEKQSQPTVRLQKSFKKKDHYFQKKTVSPEKNSIKTFRKQKENQQFRQRSPYNNNKVERKSPHLTKQVSKISLKDDMYKNKQMMMGSSGKMKMISDVLLRQVESQPYLIIEEVYERNNNFKQLLSQWQRKELYDQTDRLIYKMNQFYTNLLEQVLHKSINNLQKTLYKYEKTLEQLQTENLQLRKSKQIYGKNEEYMQILNDKLNQYYQKSQWATIFLNSFNIFNMDIEAFIKQNFLYNNTHQQSDTYPEQQFDKREGKQLKLISQDQLLEAYANRKLKPESNKHKSEETEKLSTHNQRFSK